MRNVRISLIVAVDAATAPIEGAVRSALASDMQDLEVLLVESNASDRCATLMNTLQDARIIHARLRPGSDPIRARNVGLARSQAPYVTLLDSTDRLKPDTLSSAATALDCDPKAAFAFSDFEVTDANDRVIQVSAFSDSKDALAGVPLDVGWHRIPHPQLARALLTANFIGGSAVLVRRQLLTGIGPLDEVAGCCAELDLWLRLAHRYDALCCRRIGYSHRLSAAGAGPAAKVKEAADRIEVLRREKRRWEDHVARAQLNRRIARDLASLGYAERDSGHRLRALALFASAFATSPDLRWVRDMVGSFVT